MKLLCEAYDVSRSGYASWKRRGPSHHRLRDLELSRGIEMLFGDSKGIYGSPKIHALLKQQGVVTSRHRVARLMQENGLKARCSRIYRNNTKQDRFYASINNQIRERSVTKPNQVWVGDVTYLRVNKEWRYLAVIMDKFSRRIIGWSLSLQRNAALTLTAIKRAAGKRVIQSGLYFHSDRGSEYVALKYQAWLKKHGINQSMNRQGVMNDNAEMESFFHHFKGERLHRNEYTTEKELRAVIAEYIGFHNERRIHSSLKYLTPNEYEVSFG